MKETIQIRTVLQHWELRNPRAEGRLNGKPPRLVYPIRTDSGRFVLKGYPCDTPEERVRGSVQAHLFLGNEKGLAPRVFPLKKGGYVLRDQGYWFYLMEFVEGRQLEETPEDEYRLGQAAKKLHTLQGCPVKSSLPQGKERFREWFRDRPFVREFDAILDTLPDFEKLDQCLIHSDMGPHNAMLSREGSVIFIDLDDSGTGSRYLDLGWAFIMQFVDFNHETSEMKYRFDLAESFLKGYYGEKGIPEEEYDLIFFGAEQMHISYMQSYGPHAVDALWKILNYGMSRKEILWDMISRKNRDPAEGQREE